LRSVKEQTPYLRGVIANMGYSQMGIPYDRVARSAGLSKFNLAALVSLGLDGITSQSTRPLRVVTLFGVGISVASFLGVIYYLSYFLFDKSNLPDGFTTLTLIGLISLGLNALFIGLVGEYVGRVFNNTRGLPLALIEHRIDPVSSQSEEGDEIISTDDQPVETITLRSGA
jgi:dolichol-phosphate mannosyltransferase